MEFGLTERLLFTPELSWYQELRNKKNGHLYSSIGGRYILYTEGVREFSLEISYERGEKSPKFTKQDFTKLSFGLRF
jgi:hypothetical protein